MPVFMNYTTAFLIILSYIIIYLYFARKLRIYKRLKHDTQDAQSAINPPVYINPVFKIVYEKEALQEDDIDTLANYIINFSSISGKTDLTESVNDTHEDAYYVKYNSIQFNQLIKIKL